MGLTRKSQTLAKRRSRLALNDSIGAGLSAFHMLLLGILLPNVLGLPIPIACILTAVALGFCIHSYTVYEKLADDEVLAADAGRRLRRISLLNFGYLFATLLILVLLWQSLTIVGRLLFIAEGLLLLPLSLYEWWMSLNRN